LSAPILVDAPLNGPLESESAANAIDTTLSSDSWTRLRSTAAECTACPLHVHRDQSVWGRGNPDAPVWIVGEGPGRDENRQGLPFVGDSGVLLSEGLKAIGIDSDRDVWITNLVKCWPGPGNPAPKKKESDACTDLYMRPLLQPPRVRLVVAVGGTAAQHFLGRDCKINSEAGTVRRSEKYDVDVFILHHPAWVLRMGLDKYLPIFEDELRALKGLMFGEARPDGYYQLIRGWNMHNNFKDMYDDLEYVFAKNLPVGIDTEYLPDGTLLGMSIAPLPGKGWYVTHKGVIADICMLYLKHVPLVFHYGKTDIPKLKELLWFTKDDLLSLDIRDTYLRATQLQKPHRGLKALALSELGIRMTTFKEAATEASLEGVDPWEYYEYACADADMTLRLYLHWQQQGQVPEEVARLEERILPVVILIEERGMEVDREVLSRLGQTLERDALDALDRLRVIVGDPEFNANSHDQVVRVLQTAGISLRKKTKSGQLAVTKDILNGIDHPLAKLIQDYRRAAKLKSTYVDALYRRSADNGRIHATLTQEGTSTGRFSSSNPNMQNIPKDPRFHSIFIAPPGMLFVEADYSQLELRVLAGKAQEPYLINAFREGRDIHRAFAEQLYGRQVTELERKLAKTLIYGTLYGAEAHKIQQSAAVEKVFITVDQARILQEQFRANLPNAAAYIDTVKANILTRGYAETMMGRRRYFPNIHSHDPKLIAEALREGVNFEVAQGEAADLMKRAMLRAIQISDIEIVMSVHDSLMIYVPTELVDNKVAEIKEAMWDQICGVPCPVDVKVSEHWE